MNMTVICEFLKPLEQTIRQELFYTNGFQRSYYALTSLLPFLGFCEIFVKSKKPLCFHRFRP